MFALLDIESIDRLKLTALEWEVLHRIMRAVNGETNEAAITVGRIATDLDRPQPSVSRALTALRDRHIVYSGAPGTFRVNAWLSFRGSNDDWNIAMDNETEPIWEL